MNTAATDGYNYLRQLVLDLTQNTLDSSRDYLFDTRLAGILRSHGMTHLDELVRHLRHHKDPVLEQTVAEAMIINETSFFRDSSPFEFLRSEFLPRLAEARCSTRSLQFWSAACSTGQEAYSLAMLILEHFPGLAHWNLRIEATDVSAEAIERAQAGCYHRIEIDRGLSSRQLARFFDHHGQEWIVKPQVRRLCNFRRANLCSTPFPFSRASDRFDVIFLRNVMLYFSRETRLMLLEKIHRVLAPDGALILGSSEQPQDTSAWTPTLGNGFCHYKPKRQATGNGSLIVHS